MTPSYIVPWDANNIYFEGGDLWAEKWNEMMQKILLFSQKPINTLIEKGNDAYSAPKQPMHSPDFPLSGDVPGGSCVRIYSVQRLSWWIRGVVKFSEFRNANHPFSNIQDDNPSP